MDAFPEVTDTGDFDSTGQAPFFLPGLEVEGLGELAFPLPATQEKYLVPLTKAATYGLSQKKLMTPIESLCP